MATLKAVIKNGNRRKDGTWNIVIRLTHKHSFLKTPMRRTLTTVSLKQRADFTANPIHIIQKHYEYLFSEQDLKSFATIYMVIL